MVTVFLNYWILPILFMLHDFEEIIMVPAWKRRHAQKLEGFKRPLFGQTTDGSAFAVGVLEEFIILLLVSVICQVDNNTQLYFLFLLAYTSHFVMHYVMCWRLKAYAPGVVTVTLQLPLMAIMIVHYGQASRLSWLSVCYALAVLVIVYGNLVIMHRLMAKIQVWLDSYTKPNL